MNLCRRDATKDDVYRIVMCKDEGRMLRAKLKSEEEGRRQRAKMNGTGGSGLLADMHGAARRPNRTWTPRTPLCTLRAKVESEGANRAP